MQQGPGRLEISTVLRDSPAWRAGVRPADLLVEVDGTQVSMLSPGEVSKLISGPLGRAVVLGVQHPGAAEIRAPATVLRPPACPWSAAFPGSAGTSRKLTG